MPRPRRQHYIPRMLLRNFGDDEGRLWFWRRNFQPDDVRRTAPEALFVESNLYSQIDADGNFDDSLEHAFGQLEDTAAEFMRQFLPSIRAGRTPSLSDDAWEFWYRFFYFSQKRAPAYMREIANRSGHREIIEETLAEGVASGEITEDEAENLDPAAVERIVRNSQIIAQGRPPSSEVLDLLRNRGIMVFRAPAGKSFIVGDVPLGRARIGEASAGAWEGKVSFLPVAPDVALGVIERPRAVQVEIVTRDQCRAMNEAIAGQSTIIAGSNSALLASLARSVPYTGIRRIADQAESAMTNPAALD